jgi:hypothetical protein
MDYMEFGTTPIDEKGVSLKKGENYMPAMFAEAKRLVTMLETRFPNIPGFFTTNIVNHDFGPYVEVRYNYVASFTGTNSCLFVEENFPDTWDDAEILQYTTV